jgi:hypothetical protein
VRTIMIAITASKANPTVPDRVFIAHAGLTPRSAIIKPKFWNSVAWGYQLEGATIFARADFVNVNR